MAIDFAVQGKVQIDGVELERTFLSSNLSAQ